MRLAVSHAAVAPQAFLAVLSPVYTQQRQKIGTATITRRASWVLCVQKKCQEVLPTDLNFEQARLRDPGTLNES